MTLDMLVHRLQCERGATCAWISSRCSASSVMPGSCGARSLVADLRLRTNHCIAMGDFELDAATSQLLSSVREQCDASTVALRFRENRQTAGLTPSELAKTICSVFSTYTRLVAGLLDRVLASEKNLVLRSIELLKEQYGLMRGFMATISFLSDAALASISVRTIQVRARERGGGTAHARTGGAPCPLTPLGRRAAGAPGLGRAAARAH